MSFELYRREGSNVRSVRVDIRNDELVVDTQDMGELTEDMWGDSDYEFWTRVHRDAWGDLLIALIKEFFAGDPGATDRLRDLCKKHDVSYEWGSWA